MLYTVHMTQNLVIGSGSAAQTTVVDSSQCDIGKLLDNHVTVQQLSREQKHCIFTTEPNQDSSCYPRVRPYQSGAYRDAVSAILA